MKPPALIRIVPILFVFTAVLAGCTIVSTGRSVPFTRVAEFSPGVTSTADVEHVFGKPENVATNTLDNTTVYAYQRIVSKVAGIGLPPWLVLGRKYDSGFQLNVAFLEGVYQGYTLTELNQGFWGEPKATSTMPLAAAGTPATAARPTVVFGHVRRVLIKGYDGPAMEPFISRDGQFLFFNNSNEPGEKTDLFYARRMGDDFGFMGPLVDVNRPAPSLDAVASMDIEGGFYFITTRDYRKSFQTIYSGRFNAGQVTELHAVEGNFCRKKAGWINMDAEISPDGNSLFYVEALFGKGSAPRQSDLGIAVRKADGSFEKLASTEKVFNEINTPDLEYAPSISRDGLELFFTRFQVKQKKFSIWRATRTSVDEAFSAPEEISSIEGYVEAPSLSYDGRTLYFHKKEGGQFSIYQATREP